MRVAFEPPGAQCGRLGRLATPNAVVGNRRGTNGGHLPGHRLGSSWAALHAWRGSRRPDWVRDDNRIAGLCGPRGCRWILPHGGPRGACSHIFPDPRRHHGGTRDVASRQGGCPHRVAAGGHDGLRTTRHCSRSCRSPAARAFRHCYRWRSTVGQFDFGSWMEASMGYGFGRHNSRSGCTSDRGFKIRVSGPDTRHGRNPRRHCA